MESEKFLLSLEHSNTLRPKFSIKRSGYPILEISWDGKTMQVPMAEILNFARRWEADYEARRQAPERPETFSIFPYPLMETKMNDPDCIEVGWWVE